MGMTPRETSTRGTPTSAAQSRHSLDATLTPRDLQQGAAEAGLHAVLGQQRELRRELDGRGRRCPTRTSRCRRTLRPPRAEPASAAPASPLSSTWVRPVARGLTGRAGRLRKSGGHTSDSRRRYDDPTNGTDRRRRSPMLSAPSTTLVDQLPRATPRLDATPNSRLWPERARASRPARQVRDRAGVGRLRAERLAAAGRVTTARPSAVAGNERHRLRRGALAAVRAQPTRSAPAWPRC